MRNTPKERLWKAVEAYANNAPNYWTITRGVWGEITPQFKTREEAEGQALVRNHEGAKPNA